MTNDIDGETNSNYIDVIASQCRYKFIVNDIVANKQIGPDNDINEPDDVFETKSSVGIRSSFCIKDT